MANKKYSVLAVLRVLEEYSDEEHSLYIKEICGYVEEDYGIKVGAKTVRTDIRSLIDFGYDIRFVGSYKRVVPHSDGTVIDSDINTGCYLVGEVSDDEIETLYRSLVGDRFLPDRKYKRLVRTLENLSSTNDFSLNTKGVVRVNNDISILDVQNQNLRMIKWAIVNRCVISYVVFPDINTDRFKLETKYISPCKVFVDNGIFYLAGCDNSNWYKGELVFVRIDRMRSIGFEDRKTYDISDIHGEGLISGEFAKSRFKMDRGEVVDVVFRYPSTLQNDITSYFGRRQIFMNIDSLETDIYKCSTSVPEAAMLRFALMHATEVEILEPLELREKMKGILKKAAGVYK